MPLHHHHRHHDDDDVLPYHRPDDEAKPRRPYAPSASPASAHFLLLFAVACLLLAAASLAFAVSASRRPAPLQPPPASVAFRCGRAEDSLRSFLASSRNYSAGDREKVLAVVGVHTELGSAARRAALRATWFPPNPEGIVSLEHGTGLSFRFVIGRTKDKEKMADLQTEVDMYHDFLFIDAEEDTKPPQKMLAFFKAAYDMFEAEFYVKANDEIYLRPDRLAAFLAKDRPHHRTYIGCMKKGPVVNDPNMKWYESSWELLGSEFFVHASGSLYALSSEVVGALATSKNDSLRMFDYEDVTIGSWMLAMEIWTYLDPWTVQIPFLAPCTKKFHFWTPSHRGIPPSRHVGRSCGTWPHDRAGGAPGRASPRRPRVLRPERACAAASARLPG